MIDMANALPTIMTRSKKLAVGEGLDLRTFKRDRSIVIMRTADDTYSITEDGFHREQFKASHKSLKKIMKTLLKREFPRSNKVRIYTITE
ncbi:MAG: hypothetical protein CL942_01855 [Desulfovibrio sp.]|nr:hypothetical protein [Desulfovibrio sp.]|tara:strand:- start:3765 stop:4034 length:270 start_codon:yes stop_codon:yes gene_type:complete